MNTIIDKVTDRRFWAYGLFWSWNLIFLAFMLLGFAPTVLPEMLLAVRTGAIPPAYPAYAVVLALIPAVAVVLGLTLLRRSPGKLLALGYGVEGPLMVILAVRFFIIRQATPAVTLILAVAGLGILSYLWQLLDRAVEQRGPWASHGRAIGLTLLLLVGLYASLWIAFYALPIAARGGELLGDFFQNIWEGLTRLDLSTIQWRLVPFTILGPILFLYSATLFVVMPIAVSILYGWAWWRTVRALAVHYTTRRAIVLPASAAVVVVLLFLLFARQPQHEAFTLLAAPPDTPRAAAALLEQQETIRKGLLNSYLAPQRYVGAAGEVRHVSELYEWGLQMTPQQAGRVQDLYEVVAQPILYQPVHPTGTAAFRSGDRALGREPHEAARLYQQFFDEPIVDGEREEVVRAVRSTWSVEQARANWQLVADREIYLTRQEVTVAEYGDWAEFELYEVYQNQTAQRQEVVYYFSLPESAVITGVWLGSSPDRAERFAYQVAPRGAAQATYRAEVRRQVDPALVEQIGPSQYRLRIFPVESQRVTRLERDARSRLEDGPPLHMWLTWQVMAEDGRWPLPYLAKKFNVYWDENTVRLFNGNPMSGVGDNWLPASLSPAAAPVPAGHRVDFPDGETVIARPATAADQLTDTAGLNLAVILDRSRSMSELAGEVEGAFATLVEQGAAVDVYLTASRYRGEAPSRVALADLDLTGLIYYGGQNAAELLAQFESLRAGTDYDAIFVLTDGTGYELGEHDVDVPIPGAPVWMVHLGGRFPIGYDDQTLEAIQAGGGGTVGGIVEGLTRARQGLQNGDDQVQNQSLNADQVDGYVWTVMPTASADAFTDSSTVAHLAGDSFVAFAARRLILAEMARQREVLAGDDATAQLGVLDHLHAIAVEHEIVTPYSSMLVLVDWEQQARLDRLTQQGDRFLREYEAVGETEEGVGVTVTGVPEPEEWLLIAVATAMLAWYVYSTRRPGRRQQLA